MFGPRLASATVLKARHVSLQRMGNELHLFITYKQSDPFSINTWPTLLSHEARPHRLVPQTNYR